MEVSAQIRKYRSKMKLSQEELAEKVYVSRQTVSNWETGKSYPDIHSLLLLSSLFNVSLDQLVKGDVERMKEEINVQELKTFEKDSAIFAVLFLAMLVFPVPLAVFLGWWGIAVYFVLAGVGLFYAFRVEKHKKKFDIQTYKEIIAFTEGKKLDEIQKQREIGKRPYQKVFLALGSGLAALLVCLFFGWLLV